MACFCMSVGCFFHSLSSSSSSPGPPIAPESITSSSSSSSSTFFHISLTVCLCLFPSQFRVPCLVSEAVAMDGKGPYRIYDPGGSEAKAREDFSYRQLLEENGILRERMKGLKSLGGYFYLSIYLSIYFKLVTSSLIMAM